MIDKKFSLAYRSSFIQFITLEIEYKFVVDHKYIWGGGAHNFQFLFAYNISLNTVKLFFWVYLHHNIED